MGRQADAPVHQELKEPSAEGAPDDEDNCAGDPPCLAAQICQSCGGVLTEGHQLGCELAARLA
jgi:hypothetical protein